MINSNLDKLTVIDLISEQHTVLRKYAEDKWKDVSDIEFSHTELFLLSKVEYSKLSISQAAGIIKISRQAMQKCAKKLEERGYIKFEYMDGNKRDKYMALTDSGKACCKVNNRLKEDLEREIGERIGEDSLNFLRSILGKSLL